jgi:hypothetical protein
MSICTDLNPNWADKLSAIGTISAVILTLLISVISIITRWLKRPILRMDINLKPPECQKTEVVIDHKNLDAWWFRLHVENTGNSNATGVEVTIDRVYQMKDDDWQIYARFLPSSLLWTHHNDPILSNLLPGTFKNIDFGYIPLWPEAFALFEDNRMIPINRKENRFTVLLSTQPILEYNTLSPGKYKFAMTVGAKNCRPKQYYFVLTFVKVWESDEDLVLGKSINISKI